MIVWLLAWYLLQTKSILGDKETMGDRTTAICRVGKKDLLKYFTIEEFEKRFFMEFTEDKNGYFEFFIDEANYGASEIEEDLETVCIPFIYSWGQGQTYPAGSIAFNGKDCFCIELDEEGEPTATGKTKKEIEKSLKELEKYKNTVQAIENIWETK